MLDEETELWIESVWESMSAELQKKTVIAVDTDLMNAEEHDHKPHAVIRGLTGDVLDEARNLSSDKGVFNEVTLGEEQGFQLTEAMREYVLVRILL